MSVLEDASLRVEYGRCAMVEQMPDGGPECIYEPGSELRLWVVHPKADQVDVTVDGHASAASGYAEPDEPGLGRVVTIPGDDARLLSVQVPGEEPWTLPLRATTRLTDEERAAIARHEQQALRLEAHLMQGHLDVLPAIYEQIEGLLDQGLLSKAVDEVLITSYHLTQQPRQLDRARAMLDGLPPLERYPRERAAVSIYRGNALLEQGRLVEAAMEYRRGGRYAVRMNDHGLQIDALPMYVRALAGLGYFEAAAYWGAKVLPLAREQGRIVDQVNVLIMVGQANLRLREAGQLHDDPAPWFREALGFLDQEDPEVDVGELDPARLGLATLAVLDGEPAVGLRWLEDVDPDWLTSDQVVDLHDIRLRALLATRPEDSTQVQQALADLDAAAGRAASPDAQWKAMVRRGVVLERAGDLAGAQAAYEEAEGLLDRLLPLARLGVATEVGAAGHTEGTQRLVSLLLEQGHTERALCVARRAQARRGRLALLFRRLDPRARETLRPLVTAYMDAKSTYEAVRREEGLLVGELARARREAARLQLQLERRALEILTTADPRPSDAEPTSCEALSRRETGELLLALYPHLGDLLVFAQDDEAITYRVLSTPDDAAKTEDMRWFGTLLLDPLDARLQRARRVRVLTAGRTSALAIHALTWRDRPLVVQVPVVYGLELPPAAPNPATGSAPRALVLEDPRAEQADLETDAVAQMLREARWVVRHERSTDRPADVLRQELAEVDLFHYAGHVGYDADEPARRWPLYSGRAADGPARRWPPYPGGAAAEPSYIRFGRAGQLGVEDVLMMEQVPRTVVLMGCDTGVHDERTVYGGLSLATAFVAAGAAAVVASTREIEGAEASLVGRGMHAVLAEGVVGDPGVWFMSGLRWALQRDLRERAIEDYRVFVP